VINDQYFIQNKTKVVNLWDNLDSIRPYQQRERWNISPATTYHYYLTLYQIQLKNIRSHPFMHTLQIQVLLVNTLLKVRSSTSVINLQIIRIHKQKWTKNRTLKNPTRHSPNRRFLTTTSRKLCSFTESCLESEPIQAGSQNTCVLMCFVWVFYSLKSSNHFLESSFAGNARIVGNIKG
jgi:hypothetical protein